MFYFCSTAKIALQASNNTREASEQDNLFDLLSEMSKDFLNNNNDDSRFGSVDSKMGSMQSSLRSQQSVLIGQQRILSTMPTDILSLKTKVANLGNFSLASYYCYHCYNLYITGDQKKISF